MLTLCYAVGVMVMHVGPQADAYPNCLVVFFSFMERVSFTPIAGTDTYP